MSYPEGIEKDLRTAVAQFESMLREQYDRNERMRGERERSDETGEQNGPVIIGTCGRRNRSRDHEASPRGA